MDNINNKTLNDILEVIEQIKTQLIWKPHKAEIHLKKRINSKHLPEHTTFIVYISWIFKRVKIMKEELLTSYQINVQYPEVSGFEHLETLQIRDQLALIETKLTDEEKQKLSFADRLLIKNAKLFYDELSNLIDLQEKRESAQISPLSWWWYLDVLGNLPQLFPSSELIGR